MFIWDDSDVDPDNHRFLMVGRDTSTFVTVGEVDAKILELSNTINETLQSYATTAYVNGTFVKHNSDGNVDLSDYTDTADALHGNIKSVTGATLTTIREIPSGTISTNYVSTYLPLNSHEVLLIDANNSSFDITSVTISDITHVVGGSARTDDYSCVLIFKKNSSVTDATSLMTNFNPTGAIPKIYLLNPDYDISDKTVIHIFLFYDGFNMCAIVAGYDDTPPL